MFVIAAENLPSALYTPLVVLLVAYAALTLLAGRARGKEDMAGTDRWETYGFGVLIVAAALHDRARDLGRLQLPEPLDRHGHHRDGDLRVLRAAPVRLLPDRGVPSAELRRGRAGALASGGVPAGQDDRYDPLPGLLRLPSFLYRKLGPRGRIAVCGWRGGSGRGGRRGGHRAGASHRGHEGAAGRARAARGGDGDGGAAQAPDRGAAPAPRPERARRDARCAARRSRERDPRGRACPGGLGAAGRPSREERALPATSPAPIRARTECRTTASRSRANCRGTRTCPRA